MAGGRKFVGLFICYNFQNVKEMKQCNFIPANSHALGVSLTPAGWKLRSHAYSRAGQFLTPDWKMWVVAVLLETISKNMLTQTHVRNENHV